MTHIKKNGGRWIRSHGERFLLRPTNPSKRLVIRRVMAQFAQVSLHQDRLGLLRLLLLAKAPLTEEEKDMVRAAATSTGDLSIRFLAMARRVLLRAGLVREARYFDLEALAWVRNRVYFIRKAAQGWVSLAEESHGQLALIPAHAVSLNHDPLSAHP